MLIYANWGENDGADFFFFFRQKKRVHESDKHLSKIWRNTSKICENCGRAPWYTFPPPLVTLSVLTLKSLRE